MLVGLVLRVLAARGDLWLDEILTLFVATKTPSWWALLNVHHDNVHLLTALWLRLVGPDAPAMLCRLPSIVASTATIGLAAWYVRRIGNGIAIAAAWLLAVLLMQVQYGSEARGYALAGACMVLCLELVARLVDRPSWPLRSLLAAVVLAGVASHLTFMFVLPGLFVAACTGAWHHVGKRGALGAGLRNVGPAAILGAAFAAWAVRGMTIAGGPSRPAMDAVEGALGLGAPGHGWGLMLAVILPLAAWTLTSALRYTALLLSGIGRMRAMTAGLSAIVVLPVLLVLIHPPEFIHERYLFVSVTALTILLGIVIGFPLHVTHDPTEPRALRLLSPTFVVFVVAMALGQSLLLCRTGRGDLRSAVVRAREQGRGALTLAGNNDFRTKAMLAFLVPRLPPGPEVRYVEADEALTHAPDFWLEHVPTWDRTEARPKVHLGDSDYLLVDEYPAYGLSGFTWRLYRRLSPPTGR